MYSIEKPHYMLKLKFTGELLKSLHIAYMPIVIYLCSLFSLKKTVDKWNLLCTNSNVLFGFSCCGINIVNVQQIVESAVYKFWKYCSYSGFHILSVQYVMESNVYKCSVQISVFLLWSEHLQCSEQRKYKI